nr:hypothetical protein [uncultured Psychrobacter sp.]
MKPLDVVVLNAIKPIEVYTTNANENLQTTIKPQSVVVKNQFSVIGYTHPEIEAIKPTVKPLNIVLTKTV